MVSLKSINNIRCAAIKSGHIHIYVIRKPGFKNKFRHHENEKVERKFIACFFLEDAELFGNQSEKNLNLI